MAATNAKFVMEQSMLYAAEDAAPAPPTVEETLVDVPGAQLHLVDPDRRLDLGAGTLSVVRLRQGDHCVAVLARLTPDKSNQRRGFFSFLSSGRSTDAQEPVQWPLASDVAVVKLDAGHYFFSLHVRTATTLTTRRTTWRRRTRTGRRR